MSHNAIPGKESENGVYEFAYYRKPPTRTRWEEFKLMIWDSSTHQLLGRTGKSWVQIIVFYIIFYIALAALFAICMTGLLATIDDKSPKWQMSSSLIGTNPGVGFRPISSRTEEGSLIWYDSKNETTVRKWIDLLDEFMEPYSKSGPGSSPNQVPCDFSKLPGAGQTCAVDIANFGKCSGAESYGYTGSSPCVFIKLNRIFNWKPEYYNDANSLPKDMPEELVHYIGTEDKTKLNQVWVSCQGENPADREHLTNGFQYFPHRGFAEFYYPYTNQDGYLSPLIAVQILNPTPNVLINIECRAWAKNINYRGGNQKREGSVHFEIMRDV